MSNPTPKRKLAAILSADVVGFTRMMGEDEARTLDVYAVNETVSEVRAQGYGTRTLG